METHTQLIITENMIFELENQRRNYEQIIIFLAHKEKKKIPKHIRHNLQHWDNMINFLKMQNRAGALHEYGCLSDKDAKKRISQELILALNYPNTIFEIV